MDTRTAFEHMVLTIALLKSIQEGRGASMPAQCLEEALRITPREIERGIEARDGEMCSAAEEFVNWLMESSPRPDWLSPEQVAP